LAFSAAWRFNEDLSLHVCLGTTPALQGTMIFSRVRAGEVNRALRISYHASGKSINVARGLAVLGEEAVACTPLGGKTGDIFGADLKKLEIVSRVVKTRAVTRTCITAIDQLRGEATELVEEAGRLTAGEIAGLTKSFMRELQGASMAILSGSLAKGVMEDFYAECCAAANARGVRVILDAKGCELMRALGERPLVAKPNRLELEAALRRPLTTRPALRRAMVELCDRGAQWVIVTLGKDGAIVCDGKSFWEVPGLKIKAVSAIGSGDAFSAGLSCAIRRGKEIPEACKLATACAAANAMIPESGKFYLQDVRRLVRLVRVRKC
jgi:tagatose 6-phosphate kinase